MIVVMQAHATEAQVQHVIDRLIEMGFDVHRSTGEEMTVLGALGVQKEFDTAQIEVLDGVREVVRVTQPYKLASRAYRAEGSVVDIGHGVRFSGSDIVVAAGPGGVESAEQIDRIAAGVARAGARALRGAVFQHPRSPRGFAGLGKQGLKMLREAADRNGLAAVSEARNVAEIPMLADFVDMIQVGARNMQNDDLLDALGSAGKPILLKRGYSATIEEFLLAAERILAAGNERVVLCERGMRTFENVSHNTLDICAISALKRLSHLPVIVDPSRVANRRDHVGPVARAALAAGADGLLVEVHHDPDHALVDSAQSLNIEQFEQLMGELRPIAEAVGRRLA